MERLELSGHADSIQLKKLLTTSFNQKKLKHIVIVHGGEEERQYIIDSMIKTMDITNKKEVTTIKEGETKRFF